MEECGLSNGKSGEPISGGMDLYSKRLMMKRLLLLAGFVLLASVAAFSQTKRYETTDEVPRIGIEDAKKAFDDKSAVFIDARAIETYKESHIRGAISLPFGSTDDFSSLPKGKTIIVYCS